MESVLKEINSVGGVSGSFVCDEAGEVIASAMVSALDAGTLRAVGHIVMQTLSSLQTGRRRKISDTDLVYAEGRLIVRAMPGGYLFIVCVRNINVPLLNLIVNAALRQQRGDRAHAAHKKRAPEPEAAQVAPVPAPATPAAADPMVNGTFLAAVQHELTRAVGPMAAIVIGDKMTLLGGDRQRLPRSKARELIERLAGEIGDPVQRAAFVKVAQQALSHSEQEATL